jgi:hypothetical protein
VLFSIIGKMNPNYSMIPCFVGTNPKQHLKFMLYQNRICGFLPQIPSALLFLSKKKLHVSSSSFPSYFP